MRLCRGVCGGHRRVSTSQPKSQGEHTAGFRFSSSQRAGRKPGQEVLQNQEQAVPEKELCPQSGTLSAQIRGYHAACWLWRTTEALAAHEESRFGVRGAVGPQPGGSRWKKGVGVGVGGEGGL